MSTDKSEETVVPITPENAQKVDPAQLMQALSVAIQVTQVLVITYDPGNALMMPPVNPFTISGFSSDGKMLTGVQMKFLADQAVEGAVLIKQAEANAAAKAARERAAIAEVAAAMNGKAHEDLPTKEI